ncbi:acyl carrier protein [Kitasatospora sp. MAP12-15]|uniref:acyl carrier protein n=1 Tax=unclassified Kitasatospora TaxID=2633591 RepID=UPI0024742F63|nr:acyl carrier protein [Kitasatospora sp. MAP12-44]MDH6113783.1 acyl carrier protein [Kitasatospora sp. MAP12-44]
MATPTTTPTTSSEPMSTEEIRDWLLGRVAFYLQRPAEEIDSTVKLAEYGLDSLYALTLCGDIEDEFDIPVVPTLAWDHPTVDAIAELVHQQVAELHQGDAADQTDQADPR